MAGQTLLRVMHVKQLYETSFIEFGLSAGLTLLEMNIILFLDNHAEYNTARDLCNLCMIPKSNASNGIRLLERKGLLRIEFDSTNKKIHRLFLTDKARGFVEELKEIQHNFLKTLLNGVTDEEIEVLDQIAGKLDYSAVTGLVERQINPLDKKVLE